MADDRIDQEAGDNSTQIGTVQGDVNIITNLSVLKVLIFAIPSVIAAMVLGYILIASIDTEKAVDHLTPTPPASEHTQILLKGYELLSDGEVDKAEERFDEVMKLEPLSAAPWYWKARVALAENHIDTALQYTEKALQFDPHHHHSLVLRIELLLSVGSVEEARKMAAQSRGISDELDTWLDCLIREGIFSKLFTPVSELDSRCPTPEYQWD